MTTASRGPKGFMEFLDGDSNGQEANFLPPGMYVQGGAETAAKPYPALEEAIRLGKLSDVKKLVAQDAGLAVVAATEAGLNLTEMSGWLGKLDVLTYLCHKHQSSTWFREHLLKQWAMKWLQSRLWEQAAIVLRVMNALQRAGHLMVWAATAPQQPDELALYEELFCLMTEEHPSLDVYAVMIDQAGRTPLHVASQSGNTAAVDVLLSRPAVRREIDRVDRDGLSPLALAVKNDQYAVYCRLLGQGADFSKLVLVDDEHELPLLAKLADKVEQRSGARQAQRFHLLHSMCQLMAPQGSHVQLRRGSALSLVSPRSRSSDVGAAERRIFKRLFVWADPQGSGRLNRDAVARVCNWLGFQLRADEIAHLLAQSGDPTSIDFPSFVGVFKDLITVFGIDEHALPPLPPLEAQWVKSWLSGVDDELAAGTGQLPSPDQQQRPLRAVLLDCETGDQVFHVLAAHIFAALQPDPATGLVHRRHFVDYLARHCRAPAAAADVDALARAYDQLLIKCDLPVAADQGLSLSQLKLFLAEDFVASLEVFGRLVDFQVAYDNVFGVVPQQPATVLRSALVVDQLRAVYHDLPATASSMLAPLFTSTAEEKDPRDQLDRHIEQLRALAATLRQKDSLSMEQQAVVEASVGQFTPAVQALLRATSAV